MRTPVSEVVVLKTEGRKARKLHVCDSCEGLISPGQRYIYTTGISRYDGRGYVDHRECRNCAVRYGRGKVLDGED